MNTPDLSVNLGRGLLLKNPVMVASGTLGRDGYGACLERLDLSALGAVVLKTITEEPREGNPPPHVGPGREGLNGQEPFVQNPSASATPAWRPPCRSSRAGPKRSGPG